MSALYRRTILIFLALIPFALLAFALVTQHYGGQKPCPLCILQRDGFLLYGLVACAGAIHNPAWRGTAAYAGALAASALAGLAVAAYHVWVLYHPKFGCGKDAMEEFVNGLFTARLVPSFFYASGDCSGRFEPILGLAVPEWSLVWFVVLFTAAVWFLWKCLTAAPARAAA